MPLETESGDFRSEEERQAAESFNQSQEVAELPVATPEDTAPKGEGPRGVNDGDMQERHPNVSADIMPSGQVTQENGKWYVGGWQVDKNGYYALSPRGDSDTAFARLKQMALMREQGIGIGLSKPARSEAEVPSEENDPGSTVQ